MSTGQTPSEPISIKVNGRYWDPLRTYAEDAVRTNYITITAFEPLGLDRLGELLSLGVEVQEQVDIDTYLCRFEPQDLQPIREKSYIRQAVVFRSKFKIVQDLKKTNVAIANGISLPTTSPPDSSTDVCTVDVILHHGLETDDVILKLSQEAEVNPADVEYSSWKLRVTTDRSRLKLLASQDCVRAIEEVLPNTIHDSYALEILEADVKINDTAYQGEGQVVTISDTGFDNGIKENCHQAFRGRVLDIKPVNWVRTDKDGDSFDPDLVYDPDGHGTHVCGLAVGQSLPSKLYTEGPIGGVAQKANLVVQSLAIGQKRDLIQTPADLTDGLFDPPYYDFGSRIFSNSWSQVWVIKQSAYTANDAEEVDEFVWRTQDAVVLSSAGNDNKMALGKPAIGAQAAAKNCITVGATGSKRKVSDTDVSTESILDMSSRGPTQEGRIKADVVAPGGNIVSVCFQPSCIFRIELLY